MNYQSIINEYKESDKRYPISNLKLVLTRLYPNYLVESINYDKGEVGELSKIIIKDLMTWLYLTKGNSYVLAVRFSNGLYWIQSESTETSYPELTEDILSELKWYTDKLTGESIDDTIFKYESESGDIYEQDVNKVTCTCPNFKFRTSHYPIDDERRMCKHLESIYRLYPEYLPDSIKRKDQQSEMIRNTSDGKSRYPRSLFDMYVVDIKSALDQFKNIIDKYEICGSYRRLCNMVSDLDVLIQLKDNSNWNSMLDYFENIKGWQLIQNIGRGDAKAAYLIDGFIHVDFKCVNKNNWPYALLHFTGSKMTNIEMRRVANSQGYKLNEYGLFNELTGECINGLQTEQDIFKFLRLKYKEPWER